MVKVGIVGYRNFTDVKMFNRKIKEFEEIHGEITIVVSGGAQWADTLAENYADNNELEKIIHPAKWYINGKMDRSAGPRRNTLIIDDSDYLIAFVSKYSKGTFDSINKAKKKDIPVFRVDID